MAPTRRWIVLVAAGVAALVLVGGPATAAYALLTSRRAPGTAQHLPRASAAPNASDTTQARSSPRPTPTATPAAAVSASDPATGSPSSPIPNPHQAMFGTDATGAPIIASIEQVPGKMEVTTTTWRWSGSHWVPLHTDPQFGTGANLVYDPLIQKTIALNGGVTGAPYQMWAWDGGSWQELHPTTLPSQGQGFAPLAYDPATQQVLALVPEGANVATWIFDGNTRTRSGTSSHPRYVAQMAYDPATQRLVLYGGDCYPGLLPVRDATWTWDGHDWTLQHPGTTPDCGHGLLTYDAALGQLMLVCEHPSDTTWRPVRVTTWAWTDGNWVPLHPATTPPAAQEAQLAFDAVNGEPVYFVGQTWIYRSGNWHRAN